MKCKVCGDINAKCTCICGYCMHCIKRYGHDKCKSITDREITDSTGEKDGK